MKKYLLMWLCYAFFTDADAQGQPESQVVGKVTSSNSAPFPGAIVKVDGTSKGTVSEEDGSFYLRLEDGEYLLKISFMAYKAQEVTISVPMTRSLEIVMEEDEVAMDAFEVVSTGYEQLPKERATGSFVQVNQELVDRRVSTNILDRLEDVTPGLIFNRGAGSSRDPLSIRGTGTINANKTPLIVIDNFPYDGELENINPNDIESMTVLRDAAAASIWGARAGNGVIVITTKKGRYNQPAQVSLTSNITIGEKPDLFYQPQMDIGSFVDIERTLFQNGYYNSQITNRNRTPLSPVVEVLLQERSGLMNSQEAQDLLEEYKQQDIRNGIGNFYHRTSVNQQYSLNIRGGMDNHNYSINGGFDKNLSNIRGNSFDRVTLNALNNWTFLRERVEASVGIYYTQQNNMTTTSVPSGNPYDRLADEQGIPLPLIRGISSRYLEETRGDGLLDWRYIPLNELGALDNRSRSNDLRLTGSLGYRITEGLKAEVLYQYWTNTTDHRNHESLELFNTRNTINQYTQTDPDGSLFRPIPVGGILRQTVDNAFSHNIRGQLSYNRRIKERHAVAAFGGYEIRELVGVSDTRTSYGYDDDLGLIYPVDYMTRYPRYFNNTVQVTIPFGDTHSGSVDRFVSFFGNAAYTFNEKYTLSASARKDQSNLFGVEANQRGVPLWSVGGSWLLSEEKFFKNNWLSYLKLRTTYGYNGNIDKSASAFTTASYNIAGSFSLNPGIRQAMILNPPNPNLRWERIGIFNAGLDFETRNNRLSGSLEFYNKNGLDLIGVIPMPLSSGVMQYTGNFGSMNTRGMDLEINSRIIDKKFKWDVNFFSSWIKDRVVSYDAVVVANNYLSAATTGNFIPFEGNPLHGVYSYEWAGLDPGTGFPMGYLNGEPSTAYSQIINAATPGNIHFHGSARPTHFGSFRNNFSYGDFSLSFNISYRMGYTYRRNALNYSVLLRGGITNDDFERRWQQPGDESITDIPAMPAAVNNAMQNFYNYSAALVERGDHIRFQDIRGSYTLRKSKFPGLPFQQAELYMYINNIGLLWTASNDPLDPDFRTMRPLRTFAVGGRVNF